MKSDLLYLEHYPHYTGTFNCVMNMSIEFLTLLFEQKSDEWVEIQGLIDELENEQAKTCYAFGNLRESTSLSDILEAIKEKGFWVGQWEEGSFAISLPEFKREAVIGIMSAETEINADDF